MTVVAYSNCSQGDSEFELNTAGPISPKIANSLGRFRDSQMSRVPSDLQSNDDRHILIATVNSASVCDGKLRSADRRSAAILLQPAFSPMLRVP